MKQTLLSDMTHSIDSKSSTSQDSDKFIFLVSSHFMVKPEDKLWFIYRFDFLVGEDI